MVVLCQLSYKGAEKDLSKVAKGRGFVKAG